MENNHDIKIVRFKDGLDVVCHFNYTSEDESMMELETPMMFEVRNTNLVMQHWLPLSLMKKNTVKIKTEEVLCLIEPSDEFAEYYHDTVTKMNKSSMISILEAAEAQIAKGFKPKQTILLCFGADEESSGKGATAMVKYFKSIHQKFDLVVDEGGEISTEDNKSIKAPIASIGVGEKGYVTLVLTAQKAGGHSSIPASKTAIDMLSNAIAKVSQNPMPTQLTTPIEAYLKSISAYNENFWEKMALSNLWLFKSSVVNKMSEQPTSNALIRTTLVPTVFNSGVRDNVIPTFATAYINSRILPGQSTKDVFDYVQKTIDDTNIKITYYKNYMTEPSPTTDVNSKYYKRVEKAVRAVVKDVVVAPMLMVGATDSRNYREVSEGVVNFSPLTDAKGYHGIDERMQITDFQKCINFYTFLIKGE